MANRSLEAEYLKFAAWVALPQTLREPKEQKDFASQFKLTEQTLSNWKRREGFWDLVRMLIKDWAKDKTAEVINAIHQAATMPGEKGQAANARLWLQYIEDWAEKQDISLYNMEREKKATSLLDVYKNYGKDSKGKTTGGRARPTNPGNKRSARTVKGKSKSITRSKKRSNKRNSK